MSDGPGRSASGRAPRQAVHEDVEQQLEALIRVNRREVASQRREVGELRGRQRGEVAARVILGQLRDRAAVIPTAGSVRAAPLRTAATLPPSGGISLTPAAS